MGASYILPDHKDREGLWVQHRTMNKRVYFTYSGSVYHNLKARCRNNLRRYPAYENCENRFKDFQNFADWFVSQAGYSSPSMRLDKDLLCRGNRIYSEETCTLLPSDLNRVLMLCKSTRGSLPIGVSAFEDQFRASMGSAGGNTYLGLARTPEAAFSIYKIAKEARIKSLANMYRASLSDKAYEALLNYRVEITD